MNSSFGCISKSPAAYASFSNAVVERYNGIVKTIVKKLSNDFSVIETNEVLLPYANLAKTLLLDINGVLIFQRVFRINPKIDTLNQQVFSKCLDNASTQNVHDLKRHLDTIQAVREAFVKAKKEDKLKRRSQKLIFSNIKDR